MTGLENLSRETSFDGIVHITNCYKDNNSVRQQLCRRMTDAVQHVWKFFPTTGILVNNVKALFSHCSFNGKTRRTPLDSGQQEKNQNNEVLILWSHYSQFYPIRTLQNAPSTELLNTPKSKSGKN
jgi:hypothetical protein